MDAARRLALGTVQFGLAYGVANRAGQVSAEDSARIVELAGEAGVDTLDTAIAYGESEERLGKIGVDRWRVITKLPAIPEGETDVAAWVRRSILDSLDRLHLPRVYGLLLHRPADLLGSHGSALYDALRSARDDGLAERIGVSIYDPADLDAITARFTPELVQAPFNVVDRRLATSGWLGRLRDAGSEVHVRSAFLQGLLLMGPADRPARFSRWSGLWATWHEWLAETGTSAVVACLGFVLSHREVERAVVGVDHPSQLLEIVAAARQASLAGLAVPIGLSSEDTDLINPSRWSTA